MEKELILSQFRKKSNKWEIVNHILKFGIIKNHEIHSKYHIVAHTPRISEIRFILNTIGDNIVAKRDGKSQTWAYTTTTLGGVKEYE